MTRTLNRFFVVALAATAFAACDETHDPEVGYTHSDDDPSLFSAQAKADGLSLAEGSAEAAGVLRVANELTLDQLDHEVKLDARAARNIVAARDADGPFTTLEGLDAVKYVGVRAITAMHDYAVGLGWVEGGSGMDTVHGVAQDSADARTILAVANQLSLVDLDDAVKLDARAARNIVEQRPVADLKALDAISYVGATAFQRLLDYGRENGFVDIDESLLVHGIALGSEQATAVLCVANNAPLAVLDDEVGLDSRAANNIVAAREIPSLTALDAVSYVGASAFAKLAGWAAENACEFDVVVDPDPDPSPDSVIHTGDEQCSGEPWGTRYTYTTISNPPVANTPVRINLRYNSRSPYSPTSQGLELETGPNQWTRVFTTMPAVSGWQQETTDIPAETINAAIEAMGWIRLRVNPGTYYVACSQIDVTYNCPECVACPEGQEDVGFGCQDIGAPFNQTLLDHSRGMCSRNSASLAFTNAPEAGGDGRLSLQYLPCDGGRIAVSIQTQNAGWVDVGTDSTGLSCGYASANWVIPEAFLDAARTADGTINIRYSINDTCRPGMGCANANDPCVRRVNLTYDQ